MCGCRWKEHRSKEAAARREQAARQEKAGVRLEKDDHALSDAKKEADQLNGKVIQYMCLPGPHMAHCHTVHLPLGALLIPCTMRGTCTRPGT